MLKVKDRTLKYEQWKILRTRRMLERDEWLNNSWFEWNEVVTVYKVWHSFYNQGVKKRQIQIKCLWTED